MKIFFDFIFVSHKCGVLFKRTRPDITLLKNIIHSEGFEDFIGQNVTLYLQGNIVIWVMCESSLQDQSSALILFNLQLSYPKLWWCMSRTVIRLLLLLLRWIFRERVGEIRGIRKICTTRVLCTCQMSVNLRNGGIR